MKDQDYPGTFIVIEGPDGAGTTTQAERLVDELNAHYTKEPTDKETGERVNDLISSEDSDPLEVAEAFAEDRKQHLNEEVVPRLKKGEKVVSDRYYHSSLTYQPVMGADEDEVRRLNEKFLRPDLTVILEVNPEIGISRIEDRGEDGHVFEKLSFQQKVSKKYAGLETQLDEDIVYVDATKDIDAVFEAITEIVNDKLDF